MNKLEYETIIFDNNKSNQNNNYHNKQQDHNQIQNNNSHHQHYQKQHNQNFIYNVNLKYEPQIPNAEKTTILAINITEQKSGNIIQYFETIHDKLMHIVVVGEDLSYFAHVHPSYKADSSTFIINHVFQNQERIKFG
jgi:hypothetical protein